MTRPMPPASPSFATDTSAPGPQGARTTSPGGGSNSDWLGASADLALQLDSRTNNTSLVLAFELVDSGHVLLFAADAQVGNWLSWHDLAWTVDDKPVTAADLLARTVPTRSAITAATTRRSRPRAWS